MRMFFATLLCLLSFAAKAGDMYLLQGSATGAPAPGACKVYDWRGIVLFHNRADVPADIRFVGVSNGRPYPGAIDSFRLDAHRSSTDGLTGWFPAQQVTLWVLHLDVPDTVTVEGRIEIGFNQPCIIGGPQSGGGAYGKLSFPVYRALQPANVTKVHLGTDDAQVRSRVNVAVYNAASVAATAHLEVRQLCDDQVIDSRDVVIGPNTVEQITGLRSEPQCTLPPTMMTYATVNVDQPSLSWVSVLANGEDLRATYVTPASSP
jgi:hypothetical protein